MTQLGARATGRCVTMGIIYTGTIAAVIDNRRGLYRLTDTGEFYSNGQAIEPIVECVDLVESHS